MIAQELLEILSKNGKKITRQYLFQLKNEILIQDVDYKQYSRITDFYPSGVDKILKKILNKWK